MRNVMLPLVRSFALALCLALVLPLQAADKKAPPPPPPTIEGVEKELATLEELVTHWEKQFAGSSDAKQRASVYQQLLLRAGNLANQIAQLRQLLNTAIQSPPKNDATGGLTAAATGAQKKQMVRLNDAEARLRKLRERIEKFNAPAGGKPAAGGAAGGAKPPVVGGTAPVAK